VILTEKHYRDIVYDNPHATVGFVLAARAVYATRHGSFDTRDGDTPRFRRLACEMANKYGQQMTTEEMKFEMDVNKYEQRT
jgi:hypothetical protein